MKNSIWRKVLRDLTVNKSRTFLVILAITIGVFGISVVANSFAILKREMDINYKNTNPASATLTTDYLSEDQIDQIRALNYIDEVERRDKIVGRVQIGNNEWKDIWLFVVDDFLQQRLDTFTFENNITAPQPGEILFERKALTFTKAEIGQSVKIKLPGGGVTSLKLTGSVHAPGLAPSWMEGFAYGYITHDTYLLLGGKDTFTDIKIRYKDPRSGNINVIMDKGYIAKMSNDLKGYLEKDGVNVARIEIPPPGRHPHYTQMASLLYIMEVFGLLAFLLSGVLVSALMTSILEQQTRQIGIMKALGASSHQIRMLYVAMVMVLSCTAMVIALPIGAMAGRGYANLAASILNFKIYSNDIPYYITLLELFSGIFVPILASAVPINKGSRITIREAIQDYGINQTIYSGRMTENTSIITRILPRPFLLSIRNTFRKKGRLLFSLLVMTVGGTGFIVAMNIYASMYHTVDAKMDAFGYNFQIFLEQPQLAASVESTLRGISGVAKFETWSGAAAARVYADNTTGNTFSIIAPPSKSELMKVPLLSAGDWLSGKEANEIVINQRLLSSEADIKIGDTVLLRINGKDSSFRVVGIANELLSLPTAYINMEYLTSLYGSEGYVNSAVLVSATKDRNDQTELVKQIEEEFSVHDLPLTSLLKLDDLRTSLINHLALIASFIIIMSILVILVGGLGLASTISINTMERTREIGIMRAIGASTYSILGLFVVEGILIGILSWIISIPLSLPLSKIVSSEFGKIFFESPLEFAASTKGYIIWLLLVIIISATASFNPSLKASKMEINSALYYE